MTPCGLAVAIRLFTDAVTWNERSASQRLSRWDLFPSGVRRPGLVPLEDRRHRVRLRHSSCRPRAPQAPPWGRLTVWVAMGIVLAQLSSWSSSLLGRVVILGRAMIRAGRWSWAITLVRSHACHIPGAAALAGLDPPDAAPLDGIRHGPSGVSALAGIGP